MRVLYVAAEVYPLVKTGGLGDVSGALPPALIKHGADVRLLLPGWPAIRAGVRKQKTLLTLGPAFGVRDIALRMGELPDSGVPVYLIDVPQLYDRPGNPYVGPDGRDWPDNHRCFALLGWIASWFAAGLIDPHFRPDIVHGHDWHAGLAPAYLAAQPRARAASLFTIHNLAYQGLFPEPVFGELGLPAEFFGVNGLEFYGQVSFMKAGLVYSDRISTVSPTYAREIQMPDEGCGLDGVIAARAGRLAGILNGVDYKQWNPALDPALAQPYAADDLAGKAQCKAALQAEFGLEARADALLLGVVSRLTPQKGLDLVLEAIPMLLRQGIQLALLGAGDAQLEASFRAAAAAHPGMAGVYIGYDEPTSHRIVAGADAILVPSRFEPCGLTQLYGLRYGTLPLVRRVGGLADTVVDATAANLQRDVATGFVFEDASAEDFLRAVRRAISAYRNPQVWRQLMRRAMAQDFSWDEAAAHYLELYRETMAGRQP